MTLRVVEVFDRRLIASRRTRPIGTSVDATDTEKSPSATGPLLLSRPHAPIARRLVFGGSLLTAALLYVCFASAGLMTRFPTTTSTYALLADSFLHGRLDLLIDPPQELAEIEDPYDPDLRGGIVVFEDAAYFRGRYYLYWGPVPAALAALWTLVSRQPVGDHLIVLAATGFVFLSSVLVLFHISRSSFPRLPMWLLGVGVAVVAVAHPMLWNLSSSSIWEAAITSGQAFLLGGLLLALPVIEGSVGGWVRLALVGALWGLAIASRLTLAPAVGILVVLTAWGVLQGEERVHVGRANLRDLSALFLPLAVTATLLGIYNYARFGSPTETGFRFTLTPSNIARFLQDGELFSLSYLPPNILYYGLVPVRAARAFPFLKPFHDHVPAVNMFLRNLEIPGAYDVEDVTGLLVAAPFLLFAGFPLARMVCGNGGELRPDGLSPTRGGRRASLVRISLGLLVAAMLTSVPTLTYRYVASRFLLDFSPLLMIVSVIGAWEFHRMSSGLPIRGKLATLLILMAAASTLVVSALLAVSGPASRIDDYNPGLWRWLTQFRL